MAFLRMIAAAALLCLPCSAGIGVRSVSRPAAFFATVCDGSPGFLLYGEEFRGCFGREGASLRLNGASAVLRFQGANRNARLEGVSPFPAHLSLLRGAGPGTWKSVGDAYGAIRYAGMYPGIDVLYRGGPLESEFHLQPGADPGVIRYRYQGLSKPSVDPEGNLILDRSRNLREKAPFAYQERQGIRVPVPAAYLVYSDGTVGFRVAHDPELPLVIDPTLSFSTFYGGSGFDTVTALAADAAGNIYFAGYSDSTNLPLVNSARSKSGGGPDAFIGKLNAAGQLVYATYLGGVGDDRAFGLAVDSTGNVVVTGWTASPDFPVANPYQRALSGGRNAFVAGLNPTGGLLFSTFLGGSAQDSGSAVALDGAGNAYVTGDTTSPNFPLRTPAQSALRGSQDAFLAKFSISGSLVFSTYFGGSGVDDATAVAVDGSGAPYIAGATASMDFPTYHAIQAATQGSQTGFVVKFDRTGSNVVYSTCLGGSGGRIGAPEFATGIAVDATGAAYVTGVTSSTDFPLSGALYPVMRQSDTSGFVTKINAAGTALVYSTYLGGSGYDQPNAIAIDSAGNAYVAGFTFSGDFPQLSAIASRAADYDSFVTGFNAAGNALVFSTYLGGSASDSANALSIDSKGDIYVGGQSFSYNFPLVAANQNAAVAPGGTITKITMHPKPMPISASPASGSGSRQSFAFLTSAPEGSADLVETYVIFASSDSSTACSIAFMASGSIYLLNDAATGWLDPVAAGSGVTAQNSRCAVNASTSSSNFSGNIQTLKLDLTFKTAFAGPKNIYVVAQSRTGALSPVVLVGSWTVPGAPTVGPIIPNAGTGNSQVFTFTASDPAGAANIAEHYIAFQGRSGATCYGAVIPPNAIYLLNNSGTGWLGPISAGSTATLENSQCGITASNSSLSVSGNSQTLKLGFTFKPAFAGDAVLMYSIMTLAGAASQTAFGSWKVPGVQSPAAVSINPAAGSGPSQVFTFTSSDPLGAVDLYRTFIQIGDGSARMCYVTFLSPSSIYLLDDSNTSWLPPVIIGSNTSTINGRCRVNAATSSVSLVGNTQVLKLDIAFLSGFTGSKTVTLITQNLGGLFSNTVTGIWNP